MYVDNTTSTADSRSAEAETAPAVIDYSRPLRAIGQDLTGLFPKTLVIEINGDSFEARGESYDNPFQRVHESNVKRLWQRLFSKAAAVTSASPTDLSFARVYSAEDIERIDALNKTNRSGIQKRADNYSLAERLRTMGSIVNSRKGRLKQLRKEADQFFADYWDPNGKLQTAKLTTVIRYRNEQPLLPHVHAPKELWEGYDF
jgi:hypothetical protein